MAPPRHWRKCLRLCTGCLATSVPSLRWRRQRSDRIYDNFYNERGRRAQNVAEQITRMCDIRRLLSFNVATPDKAQDALAPTQM